MSRTDGRQTTNDGQRTNCDFMSNQFRHCATQSYIWQRHAFIIICTQYSEMYGLTRAHDHFTQRGFYYIDLVNIRLCQRPPNPAAALSCGLIQGLINAWAAWVTRVHMELPSPPPLRGYSEIRNKYNSTDTYITTPTPCPTPQPHPVSSDYRCHQRPALNIHPTRTCCPLFQMFITLQFVNQTCEPMSADTAKHN